MSRVIAIAALLAVLFTSSIGACGDADKVAVFADEYKRAYRVWLQNHEYLSRAVESANLAAAKLKTLIQGRPTCSQLESANTFPLRNVLSESRVTIETMKKVLVLAQNMGNMDRVRELEKVMRIYYENNADIHEFLKRVVLARAEACGGGMEVSTQAPERALVFKIQAGDANGIPRDLMAFRQRVGLPG